MSNTYTGLAAEQLFNDDTAVYTQKEVMYYKILISLPLLSKKKGLNVNTDRSTECFISIF